MFVQMKYFIVKVGHSYKVIDCFVRKYGEGPSIMEQQQGFLNKELYVKKVDTNSEEVVVLIYWESEAHWKNYDNCISSNEQLQFVQLDYILECCYTNFQVKGEV